MAYVKNINRVLLRGRIGKEPDVRTFQGGATCVSFTMSTDEPYKDKESGEWKKNTEWHNVTVWNNRNATELRKGDMVEVEGKLRTKKYTDANRIERYQTYIQAEDVTLIPYVNSKAVGDLPSTDDF